MVFWRNVSEVEPYSPAGHSGTANRRIVGVEDGMDEMEVIIGEIAPGGTADRHHHDDIEQSMYILSGNMDVIIDEKKATLYEGDVVFIPKKAIHEVVNNGEEPVRFILIYSPPLNK